MHALTDAILLIHVQTFHLSAPTHPNPVTRLLWRNVGSAHLAISVQSWRQFWDFVCIQAHFDPATLCSLSAHHSQLPWRKLKWGASGCEHTSVSICKYGTQNKSWLKPDVLTNIWKSNTNSLWTRTFSGHHSWIWHLCCVIPVVDHLVMHNEPKHWAVGHGHSKFWRRSSEVHL